MDKIIVSDTSCLIALSKIGFLNILRDLFKEIIITKEVRDEFGSNLSEWIIIAEVKNKDKQIEIEKRLDRGEANSIAIALEIKDSTLIIDEVKGLNIAKSLHLDIIGTIGILLIAQKKDIIKDALSIILKLQNKGFRLSETIIEKIREDLSK